MKMPRSKAPETDGGAVKITMTLPQELVRRLDQHAEAERRSRSNAASLLLERALADADARRAG